MLHAKLKITADVTDPVTSCRYIKGDHYDVAEDAAKRLVSTGKATLVEVPAQYDEDAGDDIGETERKECAARIAASAPPPPTPAATPEKKEP